MKPSSFAESWQKIYNVAWSNLQASQSYIEKISQYEEEKAADANGQIHLEDINIEVANNRISSENEPYQEMIY